MDEFSRINEEIYNDIELEILDVDGGESIYLPQGRLIVPNGEPPEYHVYKISTSWCDLHNREHVYFEKLTKRGYSSVEEALKDPHDFPKNMFGTIALVKNSEKYPLEESVMPMILWKYEEGLQGTQTLDSLEPTTPMN